MNNFDFDYSALQGELTRVTVDKKPGAPRKFGNFMDNLVKMPKEDGYVTIRLLPPLSGQKFPYAACKVHNLATFEERQAKRAKNLYCGRSLKDSSWVGNCFYCDYYSHLYRLSDAAKAKGDTELQEQYVAKAKAIKGQEKFYYNAMVLESYPDTKQSLEDGPLIYSCGIQIQTMIMEAVFGNKKFNKKPKGKIFHPLEGRNLKIVKSTPSGGGFPNYNGSEWEDQSKLSEDTALIEKWLNNMHNVFDLCKVQSVDEMKHAIRVFEGIEQDAKKTFDASFLTDSPPSVSVPVTAPVIKAAPPVQQHVPSAIEEINDEDIAVDPDFASAVQAALERN